MSREITALLETVVLATAEETLETVAVTTVTAVDLSLSQVKTEVETLYGVVVPAGETCEVVVASDMAVTDVMVPVVAAGEDSFVVDVVSVSFERVYSPVGIIEVLNRKYI